MSINIEWLDVETIDIIDVSPIVRAISDIIDARLNGYYWPDEAVYAVSYSVKCWPCDWDTGRSAFFDNLEDLRAWKRRYDYWAELEDNYYCVDAFYEWDLGPQRLHLDDYTVAVNAR